MRQQNYVYLVKDINVLGLSILSILMCFTFHMKIQKEGGKKPSKRKGNTNDQVFFFNFYYGKGHIYTQV